MTSETDFVTRRLICLDCRHLTCDNKNMDKIDTNAILSIMLYFRLLFDMIVDIICMMFEFATDAGILKHQNKVKK